MFTLTWTNIELVLIYCAIILIIIFTIAGNLVVLLAFYTDRHLLTPSNHFLLSMAIADLLVGLIAMPFYSYAQINNSWPFGALFCKIWLTIDDVATMASVLSIVAITIERYWSINHSVHYRRYTSKIRIRIFSILIWLIPFLNFAPGIWLLESNENFSISKKNHSECIGAYHSHTIYLIIAQINFFAWPLIVIIILNALIVFNLYHRSHHFPSYGNLFQQQQKINILKDLQIKKNEQQQIIGHDEPIISIFHENNSHMFKRSNIDSSHKDHGGNIRSTIEEIEDGIVETKPSKSIRISLPTETETKLTSSLSSSNCCIRFKRRFIPSSTNTSTRTSHSSIEKSHHSLFNWRNSSLRSFRHSKNTNSTEQRTGRRLRRDKRAATSLLILVLVFMLFLLPYVVVVVVGSIFSIEFLTDTNGQVYSAAFWLLWLNSTVNPILYPFIQPKFRDAYRKIYSRLTRRRPRLVSLIADIQRER